MKVIVVYDDTGRKSEVISDIIGDKGFADVVVKKKTSIKDTGMTMIPITIIRRMSLSRRPKRLSSAQ